MFMNYLNSKLDNLHTIWDEIGMSDELRGDRVQTCYQHLRALVDQMVSNQVEMTSSYRYCLGSRRAGNEA